MTHSLTLGSLHLTGSTPDTEHSFVFNVLTQGVGFGVAAGVREVIASLLADGDLVRTTRFGNREVTFVVRITGPSLAALAYGEAALRREIGRRNTLTWQAPDVLAEATVFDVIDSSMVQSFADIDELNKSRKFTVTLTCAPFARSAAMTVVPALDASGSVTVITVDNADSPASWSAAGTVAFGSLTPVTVTDMGSYLRAELTGSYPYLYLTLTRAALSLTATPYLLVETGGTSPLAFDLTLDGVARRVAPSASRALPGGKTLWALDTGGGSFTSMRITANIYSASSSTAVIDVHDVSASSHLPQVTPRQVSRVIEVGGTERTPASVHVQTPDGVDPLDLAIVHTSPEDGSGYSPPLQRWRQSSATRTTDATAFSGHYEIINVDSWYAEVPTSALPEGGYTLVARLRRQTAGTSRISWSTSTIFPDSTTQQGFTLGQVDHDFAVGNEWEIVGLATLSLPSVRTKAGKVQIALQVEAATPIVTLDEAWLFREGDDCALSIVETDRPHLWLNSPDTDSPVPTVWVGDGHTTQVHPGTGLRAMGTHVLHPDGTAIFTAALVDYPLADGTFYKRWHSNAAE